MNRKDENQRLEEAALNLFMKAYSLKGSIKRRERPDFEVEDEKGLAYGIEVAHLYDEGEAEVQLGRGNSYSGTTEDLIKVLNALLLKKLSKISGYDKFDKNILVIRVADQMLAKEDFERLYRQIKGSHSSFDEIWLLTYNWKRKSWSDLLPLPLKK